MQSADGRQSARISSPWHRPRSVTVTGCRADTATGPVDRQGHGISRPADGALTGKGRDSTTPGLAQPGSLMKWTSPLTCWIRATGNGALGSHWTDSPVGDRKALQATAPPLHIGAERWQPSYESLPRARPFVHTSNGACRSESRRCYMGIAGLLHTPGTIPVGWRDGAGETLNSPFGSKEDGLSAGNTDNDTKEHRLLTVKPAQKARSPHAMDYNLPQQRTPPQKPPDPPSPPPLFEPW